MGLFSSKPPSYLGIDLGLGGVKITELRNNKGRAQLLTYGFAEEVGEVGHDEYFKNHDKIASTIKKICHKANTTSKLAIASLPTYTVFDSVITLPQMPKKELKEAIEIEAQKLITRPLEEMVLYTNIINNQDSAIKEKEASKNSENKKDYIVSKESAYVKILLTAAPKDYVNKYIDIFQKAGLKLLSLETAAFALTRSLVGLDRSQVLIADIGFGSTEIIIISEGLPVFSRSVDVGGVHITQALEEKLNMSVENIEQLKIDLSTNIDIESQQEIFKIIERVVEPIINEIKYSINLYFNRFSILENGEQNRSINNRNIEKIILAGGGSSLFGLVDYLKKELKTRVFIGDPWSRVIYPQDLKPVLDNIGPKFAISTGLAMREIK